MTIKRERGIRAARRQAARRAHLVFAALTVVAVYAPIDDTGVALARVLCIPGSAVSGAVLWRLGARRHRS